MMNKKIIAWVIVIIYMIVIFALSAQNGVQSNRASALMAVKIRNYINGSKLEDRFPCVKNTDYNFVFRKLTHALEYFTLSIFIYFALSICRVKNGISILAACCLSILYAVFDEYHQCFVTGRTSSMEDVVIDAGGILVASLILFIKQYITEKIKRGRYE